MKYMNQSVLYTLLWNYATVVKFSTELLNIFKIKKCTLKRTPQKFSSK